MGDSALPTRGFKNGYGVSAPRSYDCALSYLERADSN
jgi:hypothetical protein